MKTLQNLIITGWGYHDYACAAAVALRASPNDAVIGVSKNRLPECLEEIAAQENVPGQILIIGVSLAGDPDRAAAACLALAAKGVTPVWYSAIEWSADFFTRFKGALTVKVDESQSLHRLVVAELKVTGEMRDLDAVLSEKPNNQREKMLLLLAATSCHYRNYQDADAYADAIRYLAFPKTELPDNLKRIVNDYTKYHAREWVGVSEATQKLREEFKTIGRNGDCRVLILGETGTGKETAALLIHGHSPRRNKPFITFNCAVLSPQLLESQLFGHEKGAFTGAQGQHLGAFEQADGGTIFLDEIGELSPAAQAGLLRVLQEGRFLRMGGDLEIAVDVRVLTATHRDLPAMVRNGTFREDLMYRLSTVVLPIPPLRQRRADIPVIANACWRVLDKTAALTPAQHAALADYAWPGNIRELYSLLERAQVLHVTDFGTLIAKQRQWLAGETPARHSAGTPAPKEGSKDESLEHMIRQHIRQVVAHHDGNLTHATQALGIARNTVKKYLAPSS
jgi:transcriptional regulator with GAF, ATPase, and Fis domain